MSVTIGYKGSAGNHMFQYLTALIYCDKHSIDNLFSMNIKKAFM